MTKDEQAIRDLVATWQRATEAGDLDRVLGLMSEDVVFLTPGRPQMRGREEFAALWKAGGKPLRMDLQIEIKELAVHGDWAHAWTHIRLTVVPSEGAPPVRRSGPTLTIYRKEPN